MAYYDADENYMYVHSIERLDRAYFGTLKPISWLLSRVPSTGEHWRSWRLLDREGLTDEIQIVVINHGTVPGKTKVGVYSRDDELTFFEEEIELRRRGFAGCSFPRRRSPAGRSGPSMSASASTHC